MSDGRGRRPGRPSKTGEFLICIAGMRDSRRAGHGRAAGARPPKRQGREELPAAFVVSFVGGTAIRRQPPCRSAVSVVAMR